MGKFYFTYGVEGHPFYGGWTEIEAECINVAIDVFRLFHPDDKCNTLNCCWVYGENDFKSTSMYEHGNYGFKCHEKITVNRTIYDKED